MAERRSPLKIGAGPILIALGLALGGCGHHRAPRAVADRAAPAEANPFETGWRAIATAADRERLRNWRTSWTQAIAKIEAAGLIGRVRAEGILLQPDAALSDPALPPGAYRCRVIKLGSIVAGGRDFVAYPPFTCLITREAQGLKFTKTGGSQRPVGWLFETGDARMIFLGTMLLGDETRAMDYGRDPDRDMAGALERIGPARWRLVLPAPRWESMIDVIELVPQ